MLQLSNPCTELKGMGNGATECGWRHAPEMRAEDFGDFEKVSQLCWVLPREKTVDLLLLAEALRWVRSCWAGGRCTCQNRKNVYLSPNVEEPLNSKVIKSFVPELRSRKCFSCFEIPVFYIYIYIYIYIYEHYMSISHIRIWLWYIYNTIILMLEYVLC